MFSQEVVVSNPTGLHARPAGQLAQLCKSIPADIRIITGARTIDPKGIMAILTAGLVKGTKITVQVEGDDEQQHGERIVTFLKELKD